MGGGSGRGLSFGATIGSGELPLVYSAEKKVTPQRVKREAVQEQGDEKQGIGQAGQEAGTGRLLPEEERSVMWVRYMGGACEGILIIGKVYEVIAIERGRYRIVDETGEEHLYPHELFEVVGLGVPVESS